MDLGTEYTLLSNGPIGEGGFAQVYLVRHKEFGYIRAIKKTKAGFSEKELRKFHEECKLLLKIGNGGHPNIIRVYQPQLYRDYATVEMDYIKGLTLHDYIKSLDFFVPMAEIWKFVHDVVGALAYCHVDIYPDLVDPEEDSDKLINDKDNGREYRAKDDNAENYLIDKYSVGHNDLHSTNIMKKKIDGSYILLDFGLAIQHDTPINPTALKGFGVDEYRAPERFDWPKLDQAITTSDVKCADVYSIGILLVQLLTGHVPFSAKVLGTDKIEEMHKSHQKKLDLFEKREKAFKARYSKEYERDYPAELETIIEKCLEVDTNKRYKNAKELLVDLNKVKSQHDKIEAEARNIELEKQLKGRIQALESNLRDCEKEVESYQTEASAMRFANESYKEKIKKEKNHKQTWKVLAIISLIIIIMCITLLLFFTKAINHDNETSPSSKSPVASVPDTTYSENIMAKINPPIEIQESQGYLHTKQPESPTNDIPGNEFRNMTFNGNLQNGFPHGFGIMTFKQRCRIDNHDENERIANVGDYIDGQWENGHLIMGTWYGPDKVKKEFINIGHIEGGHEADYQLYLK